MLFESAASRKVRFFNLIRWAALVPNIQIAVLTEERQTRDAAFGHINGLHLVNLENIPEPDTSLLVSWMDLQTPPCALGTMIFLILCLNCRSV